MKFQRRWRRHEPGVYHLEGGLVAVIRRRELLALRYFWVPPQLADRPELQRARWFALIPDKGTARIRLVGASSKREAQQIGLDARADYDRRRREQRLQDGR